MCVVLYYVDGHFLLLTKTAVEIRIAVSKKFIKEGVKLWTANLK